MTKKELVEAASAKCRGEYTKSTVEAVFNCILSAVREELLRGGEIRLAELGLLRTIDLKPTRLKNIRTGEDINLPNRRSVRFRPFKEIRDRLNYK